VRQNELRICLEGRYVLLTRFTFFYALERGLSVLCKTNEYVLRSS